MPKIEPKMLALTIVPVAGFAAGLAFYFSKKRTRIVTVAVDKPQVAVCYPAAELSNWYTVTVTITDGFGNPVSEEFTFNIYIGGEQESSRTVKTDASGTWSATICWQAPTAPSQHIDTEERITVVHEAICKNAKGTATVTLVAPVCLSLPCTCR